MRTWIAAWTVGSMLAAASAASAQDATEARRTLTVTVHVTDYAGLSAKDLAEAEARATAAYAAAGLDLGWSSAPWPPETEQLGGSPSIGLRLLIIAGDMAEKKCRLDKLGDKVMGIATSEGGGRLAYVFYDRIVRVALEGSAPVLRGLGQVMAHEIGHLLLGANSHSSEGLMRANWSPREPRVQTFTASQVRQILRRFVPPSQSF